MDPDIARWTLEFLLRQNLSDKSIDKLLKSLPLTNNPRLKKTILLRSIESKVSHNVNCVSETVLDLFERIEAMDERVLDSMKSAYCAVAVECTVRHLREGGERKKYCEAVERIWRGRLRVMEESGMSGLVSAELSAWRERIEAAAIGFGVCEEILKWDRSEVVRVVKVYLDEARVIMGPSFLELAGEAVGLARDVGSKSGGVSSLVKMLSLVKRVRGVGEKLVRSEWASGDENRDVGDDAVEKEVNAPNSNGNAIAEVGGSGAGREVSLCNVVQGSGSGSGSRDEPLVRDGGTLLFSWGYFC